jgi:putative heme transporter
MTDATTRRRDPDTPVWLARTGRSAWMVTGIVLAGAAVIAAVGFLLPFLTPPVIAIVLVAVLLPVVDRLARRGVSRGAGAALATLLVPAGLAVLTIIVLRGLRGQGAEWKATVAKAGDQLRDNLGADPVSGLAGATDDPKLLLGVASVLTSSASALVGLALGAMFALYILLYLLKDAHSIADGIVTRVRLPRETTRQMLTDARRGLSRYVVGTTVVAALDAAVITLGAVVLDLPLLLPIALVTFVGAYVPYLGAWVSAAFAVVVALGAGGIDTGLWMLAIVLVTQNILEGLLRPYAFGVALDMHPLTVMGATVIGSIVAGLVGVFIAPAVAAIAISWVRTIRAGREAPTAEGATDAPRPREPETMVAAAAVTAGKQA